MLTQFSRTELLLGKEAMNKLEDARVAVFGIGGVGGYVCEALACSGVGKLDLIDYDVEDEYEEDDEEGTITIYGNPKSYAAIQKHLEECGFEDVGGDFTYIPNDMKEVTPEQRETLDKMIERLEEFDDVQTVYTNMQPEEGE